MAVSAKGSFAWSYRWFSVPAFLYLLLGCGSDLPPDTGGGTIRGAMKSQCEKLASLIDPFITVMATDKLLDEQGNIIPSYLSLNSLPARPFPDEGIQYELKGLYPDYEYIIYAVISDVGVKDWTAPVCAGVYPNVCEIFGQEAKIKVTNVAATTGIDFTLYNYESKIVYDPCLGFN